MRNGAGWRGRGRRAALAGAMSVVGVSSALGQTTASWLLPVNGTWTDATKWSTNPFFPDHDNPLGSDYAAVIDVLGSYSIGLASDVRLHSFTLNSPSATLIQTQGQLQGGTMSINNGLYTLRGGSIWSHAIYVSGGGEFRAEWGELSGGVIKNTIFTGAEGKTLILNSNWRNEGVIKHSAGTLEMRGVFSTGDIGVIERSGGQVVISGTIFNTGTTLQSGSWSGPLLIAGRVEGGTLAASTSHPIVLSNVQLYDVTVGDGSVSAQSGLRVASLSIASGSKLSVGGSMTFGRSTTISHETLSGNGELGLNQVHVRPNVSQSSLTIGSGITVFGTGSIAINDLTSNGILDARGGTLRVLGRLTNTGLLRASNQGSLRIEGDVHPGGISNIDSSGGKVLIAGNADNAGTTTSLDGVGETLHVSGSIEGGTIQTSNGAKLIMAGGNSFATLDDIVVDTDVYVDDGAFLRFESPAVLMPGRKVFVTGTNNQVTVHSTLSGEILFQNAEGSALRGQIGVIDTIGPGIIARTAGGNAEVGHGVAARETNNFGQLVAESAGNKISLFGTNHIFNNHGVLRVTGGSFSSTAKLFNFGTIDVQGGTFDLAGTWDNDGTILLSGGVLNVGGVVDVAKVGTLTRTGGLVALTGTFNNSVTTADLTSVLGPWHAGGSARIIGGSIVAPATGQPLLISNGSLVVDGASLDTDVLLDAGSTIRFQSAWSKHGLISGDSGSVIFAGSFSAGSIGSLAVTNSNVDFVGTINNSSSTLPLTAGAGSTFTLRGGKIIAGTVGEAGQLLHVTSGTLDSVGLAADLVVTDQTLVVENVLTGLSGPKVGLVDRSLIEFRGGSMLQGPLEVIFNGTSSISTPTLRPNSGSSLTLGSGVVVRTGSQRGALGGTNRTVLNHGMISAQTAGKGITVSGSLTNTGFIEARNGGSVSLNSAALSNFSAGSLNAGHWAVYANSTMTMGSSTITTNNADILLDGVGSTFVPINQLRTNLGSFTIDHGRNFTTVGSLTSSGFIGVGTNSTLYVSGDLNNTGSIDLVGTIIVNHDPGPGESLMFDTLSGQIGTSIFTSYNDPAKGIGSADNALLAYTTFNGVAVDASTALLMLTYLGDANLDGVANLTDFDLFLDGYAPSEGSPFWVNGDFDYSGVVDLADFESFLMGYYALGGSVEAITDAVANSGLPNSDQEAMQTLIATVPEPVGVWIVGGAGALGAALRRRRWASSK